jgi:hypothetical protein
VNFHVVRAPRMKILRSRLMSTHSVTDSFFRRTRTRLMRRTDGVNLH